MTRPPSFLRAIPVGVGLATHGVGAWAAVAQPMTFTHPAGSAGGAGWFDGSGTGAWFYNPGGVAVDGSGNVHVADSGNHTIRKATASGVVTTLAGPGVRPGNRGDD